MPYRIPPLTLDEIEELLAQDAWTQRNALEDMDMFSHKSEYEQWRDELEPPEPDPTHSGWWLVAAAVGLVALGMVFVL